jgi:DNA-binding IclR family transcriptional regulator
LTKETVHLAELNGTEVVYLDKIDGPLSISMRSRIGISKPSYCTGLGKILLAYQNEERLAGILDQLVLKPHTENTITDKSILVRRLKEYRERGYSLDNEEIEIGLFCIAAPITDITGRVVAAISLSAPKYRVENRLEELIPQVKRTAAGISFELGSHEDDE